MQSSGRSGEVQIGPGFTGLSGIKEPSAVSASSSLTERIVYDWNSALSQERYHPQRDTAFASAFPRMHCDSHRPPVKGCLKDQVNKMSIRLSLCWAVNPPEEALLAGQIWRQHGSEEAMQRIKALKSTGNIHGNKSSEMSAKLSKVSMMRLIHWETANTRRRQGRTFIL